MNRVVPVITETSPVPELMTFLRYAIFDEQFSQAETILVNRERGLRAELEKLRESYEGLKQDQLCVLEKKPSAGELEKVMWEKERGEVSEKLEKLYVDHAALSDRMKEGEDKCRKLTEKLTEAEEENNRIVVQVKEAFEGLERKMGEILKYEEDKSVFVADFTAIRKLLKRRNCEMSPGDDQMSDASAINGGLGGGGELGLPSPNTSGNKGDLLWPST